ncbi:aconitase X [Thermodesulfobacteriota bacterium]
MRALKEIADRQGLTEMITKSGAVLMTDTCPCIARVYPKGVKTAATDSAKHAHYMPAILGFPTWVGSQEDCIRAATSGKWGGEGHYHLSVFKSGFAEKTFNSLFQEECQDSQSYGWIDELFFYFNCLLDYGLSSLRSCQ